MEVARRFRFPKILYIYIYIAAFRVFVFAVSRVCAFAVSRVCAFAVLRALYNEFAVYRAFAVFRVAASGGGGGLAYSVGTSEDTIYIIYDI